MHNVESFRSTMLIPFPFLGCRFLMAPKAANLQKHMLAWEFLFEKCWKAVEWAWFQLIPIRKSNRRFKLFERSYILQQRIYDLLGGAATNFDGKHPTLVPAVRFPVQTFFALVPRNFYFIVLQRVNGSTLASDILLTVLRTAANKPLLNGK